MSEYTSLQLTPTDLSKLALIRKYVNLKRQWKVPKPSLIGLNLILLNLETIAKIAD